MYSENKQRFIDPLIIAICVLFSNVASAVEEIKESKISVYVSAKSGERLTELEAINFRLAKPSVKVKFELDETKTLQKMIGFGASFLESGAIVLSALPISDQEAVLRALFDPVDGAGFSAMKTVIGATDFMTAGPYYTYDDTPGDIELRKFSIERDLGRFGLVTYIKRARKYGSFVLQATMDYPPDWMLFDAKSNQNVDPKYYDVLARYYLRYVQAYEREGISIDYLSLFNEPGNYTKISYTEIKELLVHHVGPLFAKLEKKIGLQVSDPPSREYAKRDVPTILDDPEARKFISAISYHGYDAFFRDNPLPLNVPANDAEISFRYDTPTAENGYDFSEFRHVKELHERYPALPLWMTEVCYFDYNGNAGLPSIHPPIPKYEFDDGDFWGQQIFSDIEAGASGWTYWNMILDEAGGPWLVSPEHGDGEYNSQHPVVIIDRKVNKIYFTGLYYYLAHFSKFVRPGSVRLEVAGSEKGVRLLAFQRPDGKRVVELINSNASNQKINLRWHDQVLDITLKAQSITTLVW